MTVVIASIICLLVAWLPPLAAVLCSLLAGLVLNARTSRTPASLVALSILLGAFWWSTAYVPPSPSVSWAYLAVGAVTCSTLLIALGGPARRAAEVQGRFFVDRLGIRTAQLGSGTTDDILVLAERLKLAQQERWLAALEGRLRFAQFELLFAAVGSAGVAVTLLGTGSSSLSGAAQAGVALACATCLLCPSAAALLVHALADASPESMRRWWLVRIPWALWMEQGVRNVRLSAGLLFVPDLNRSTSMVSLLARFPQHGSASARANEWLLQQMTHAALISWFAGASPQELAALGTLSERERSTVGILRMLRYLQDDGVCWYDRRWLMAAMCTIDDNLPAGRVPMRERVRLAMSSSLELAVADPTRFIELPPLVEAALNDCALDQPLPRVLQQELQSVLKRVMRPGDEVILVVGARIRPFVVDAMRALQPSTQRVVVTRLERTRSERHRNAMPPSRTFDSGPLESGDDAHALAQIDALRNDHGGLETGRSERSSVGIS